MNFSAKAKCLSHRWQVKPRLRYMGALKEPPHRSQSAGSRPARRGRNDFGEIKLEIKQGHTLCAQYRRRSDAVKVFGCKFFSVAVVTAHQFASTAFPNRVKPSGVIGRIWNHTWRLGCCANDRCYLGFNCGRGGVGRSWNALNFFGWRKRNRLQLGEKLLHISCTDRDCARGLRGLGETGLLHEGGVLLRCLAGPHSPSRLRCLREQGPDMGECLLGLLARD